jgi:carboxyl-terminal processing protease
MIVIHIKNEQKMKKLFLSFIVLLISVYGCKAQNNEIDKVLNKDHRIDTSLVVTPESFHQLENTVITRILRDFHYRKVNLNDSLSSAIFDDYLKVLDYQKMYFLKSDIAKFEPYRYQFDDFMKNGDLKIPFEMFDLLKKRMTEAMKFISADLKGEIDLSKDEKMVLNRKDAPYANTADERNDLWRKRDKYDVLNAVFINKTKTQKECREQVLRGKQNLHKLILQYTAEDIFQLYITSVTTALDPHTDYMSPSTLDQFKINMNTSVEGIGATLGADGDYITIQQVVPGGPAFKSKQVGVGDKIMSVAQGDTGRFVDIVNWRTDDAVKLIRGKPGSIVRLQLIKAKAGINDLPVEIKIVRDKVVIEEQKAKKEIIDFEENNKHFKMGIVDLPTYYNGTTKDVKAILEDFKKEKVDGVIVDLRGNGGGSLPEVIEMAGLFIKSGPIVQVKDYRSYTEVDQDPDPEIVYDGPLAVMIDYRSASASEIFAAAIQDYGRGLIIGDKSYGKGTVQTLLELKQHDAQLARISDRLGQLKLTFAKFYRINGSSTQRKGVTPDIQYPTINAQKEFGEDAQPSALPWDQIATSKFTKYADLSKVIPKLKEMHEKRIKNNNEFKYLLEDIAEYNKQKDQKDISLNEKVRRKEMEDHEKKKKEREQLKIVAKKEVDVPEKEADDYQIKEGANILADFILLKK